MWDGSVTRPRPVPNRQTYNSDLAALPQSNSQINQKLDELINQQFTDAIRTSNPSIPIQDESKDVLNLETTRQFPNSGQYTESLATSVLRLE